MATASAVNSNNFEGNSAPTQTENGKWVYIDSTGKFAIQPKYTDAQVFRNGEALINDGKEYYFINDKGKKVREMPKHNELEKD